MGVYTQDVETQRQLAKKVLASMDELALEGDSLMLHYGVHCLWNCDGGAALELLQRYAPPVVRFTIDVLRRVGLTAP